MATNAEFPNNCTTNAYVLHDFGEVAYIVCTVATPTAAAATTAFPSRESNIARLKNTEKQFRQSSILASIDIDKLELFTFYKKVDVLKDQRTLLNKFGLVLRSNACTIAYKAASKVPDLLKPENARLYRLFVAALLASVQVYPLGDRVVQPLGLRSCLVDSPTPGQSLGLDNRRLWSLYRTYLQVIPTGQVILTVAGESSLNLVSLADIPEQSLCIDDFAVPTILTPIGHTAVYRNGWIGRANAIGGKAFESGQISLVRLKIWRELVSQWLQGEASATFDDEGELWVELQIPMLNEETVLPQPTTNVVDDHKEVGQLSWHIIYWPARLCFTEARMMSAQDLKVITDSDDDPVQFMQDWIRTASERQAEVLQMEKADAAPPDDDDPLFADEGPFDNPEHFQPFGPPAFPASQTVYPTPPDVVMTHATPGMSSVDGFAMTPANLSRTEAETHIAPPGHVPAEFDAAQAAGVGSGFYDEDLFEEMPDDNFGEGGAADEPNWDFFDEPDMEVDPSESITIDHKDGEDSVPQSSGSPMKSGNLDESEPPPAAQLPDLDTSDPKPTAVTSPKQTKALESQGVNHAPSSEFFTQPSAQSDSDNVFQGAIGKESGVNDRILHGGRARGRRRSSIYNGVVSLNPTDTHDSRYSAEGEFFFDSHHYAKSSVGPRKMSDWMKRPSSTSSESESTTNGDSMSLNEDYSDQAKQRVWTEYDAHSPEVASPVDTHDEETVGDEAQQIFAMMKTTSASYPTTETFHLFNKTKKETSMTFENAPMVAQILVDQISQTALRGNSSSNLVSGADFRQRQDVGIDLTNMNSSTAYATVGQLLGIKAMTTNSNTTGRIAKLQDWQIAATRGDQKLVVSTTILPFWDTLGLRPNTKPKSVTAFCIHPEGGGYADGCVDLLSRMADAYSSSNLGTHAVGRLAGLTNDGLLTWDAANTSVPDLLQTAQRFGRALASTSHLKGNILIYMIGLTTDSQTYLEACVAFCGLFQAFKQSRVGKAEDIELALQIIPVGFVASAETPIVPSQMEYFRLALEVYNRLPPAEINATPAAWDYAIVLSEEQDAVYFNLEIGPRSPLSKHGPGLHVAYSLSKDHRWVCVTWTDEFGHIGLSMTYATSEKQDGKGRLQKEIIRDVWEVSHDIMKKQHGKWRLVVARNGFYEPAEVNEWLYLANQDTKEDKSACQLYLVAVELDPSLKILAPASSTRTSHHNASNSQSNIYGTPVSTPQAMTTSPEQHIPATPTPGGTSMNAPTPPDPGFDPNNESDLMLSDPAEESWAVILPYGVNQSVNMLDVRPAMSSGYLIKRLGTKDEEGVTAIGLHLTHGPALPPTGPPGRREEMMEEILSQYRGLAVLAVTRGCVDPMRECIPWHIISAVKGSRALGEVM